jgi:H+-transporting ATPase
MESVKDTVGIDGVKVHQILDQFKTDLSGLSGEEAAKRQKENGYNEIAEKKKNPLLKFLAYFWGPIPIMIEVAAILSLFVHHFTDFVIIMVLLLMNTLVGFWHDRKADNAIELLKKKLAPNARVLRDNEWKILPARELVQGDIIRLRLGDIVPADVGLIEGDYLECDESALTGESMPADKQLGDQAYSGSVIVRGEMTAVVSKIGMDTYFGKTAKLVESARTKSHFERAVIRIGNFLIIMAIFLVLIIVIVALFRQDNLMETLRFAMVLTVASIPVALPAILTVTMAIGAINLSKKKAIVSKLAAIEELAGVDVLCSDKTGTLTQNKLTIAEPIPADDFNKSDVLLYAALASRKEDNDNIDNAVLQVTNKKTEVAKKISQFKPEKFHPFDPVVKRTEAQMITTNGEKIGVSKGAPQVMFELCRQNISNGDSQLYKIVDDYAGMGYRMIAVARRESPPEGWQLVGLIPLYDPPREDSAQTIKDALSMGVEIKMVTGDNSAIARQIAKKLGIKPNILHATDLKNKPTHELEELVGKADGFAEVFPEHKFSIVQILQKLKHIVGMTGDGVNDAPALKKADCGIAVAGATDAAKSAASIVLTSPGLSVIIDSIKESRKIFQRMTSYSIYRIAETVRVLFFITATILAFNFYPVTAVMIVLLALLNDAPIMAIAGDNVRYSNRPEKWNMKIVLGLGMLLGTIGVISSFFIFYIGKNILHLNLEVLQAFIFLKLAVAGHLTIFLARTRKFFWSIKPSKGLLWSAIVTKILATFFAVYGWFIAPIGWKLALIVWGYAIVAFIITDVVKRYYYKFFIDSRDES